MKNYIFLVACFCATVTSEQGGISTHPHNILNLRTTKGNSFKNSLIPSDLTSTINDIPTPQIVKQEGHQNVATKSLSNPNSIRKTFYVSPKGNDGNNGLSIASAYKTVSKINGLQFNSDTIVLEGNLSGVIQFDVNDVSTSLNPIVVSIVPFRTYIKCFSYTIWIG